MIEFFGEALFWGGLGAFAAWNLPQPPWAKWAQAKIMAGWKWFNDRV